MCVCVFFFGDDWGSSGLFINWVYLILCLLGSRLSSILYLSFCFLFLIIFLVARCLG